MVTDKQVKDLAESILRSLWNCWVHESVEEFMDGWECPAAAVDSYLSGVASDLTDLEFDEVRSSLIRYIETHRDMEEDTPCENCEECVYTERCEEESKAAELEELGDIPPGVGV